MSLLLILSISAITTVASSADPISVGDRTCLFLDDRFVAEQSGMNRTWHQGKPRPEVAIEAGKQNTWEHWPHMFGSVIHDPKNGLYRMYYESAIMPHREGEGRTSSFTCYICYAESKDGKTWTKPKLGLFDDLGSKENNIVVPDAELAKVFVDPLETDPGKRLKMFAYLQRAYPYPNGGQGECLLSSGDGVRWKFEGGFNSPVYEKPEYANDFTDSRMFMWDPLSHLYRAYIRTFAQGGVAERKDERRRAIGVSSSQQVNREWTPIVHVLAADERDDAVVAKMSKDPNAPDWAELYVMPFFNYGNHYLGLLSILYFIDKSDFNGGGDLQLTFSHDAKTWQRHPERQTLIGPSSAAPELFPTYIQMNEPLILGNEMWVYYTEANGAHPINPAVGKARSQIRAAVWRKDGFVSMDCAARGTLTSPLLAFEGTELRVNFQGESLRVLLIDQDGKTISESEPLQGDSVAHRVKWKHHTDLAALEGKPVRLKLDLVKGCLWSFRFAR